MLSRLGITIVKKNNGWHFFFGKDGQKVIFSARQANKLLSSLRDGFEARIMHTDNSNRKDTLVAVVSSVNFNKAYDIFLTCQTSLNPYAFMDIKKSSVYFDSASFKLQHEAKQMLDHLIVYAKDPDVSKIELNGFTDTVGNFRANHKLASKRAEQVRDYLVKAGVSEQLIKIRVFGEQRNAGDNSTVIGRKKNRKVLVKIVR